MPGVQLAPGEGKPQKTGKSKKQALCGGLSSPVVFDSLGGFYRIIIQDMQPLMEESCQSAGLRIVHHTDLSRVPRMSLILFSQAFAHGILVKQTKFHP